jgi:hypothetical protein
MTGFTIYYLHYLDPEFKKPAWNLRQDFVKSVGAPTSNIAIAWVKSQFQNPIKIMGVGAIKLEDCEILINE